MKNNKISIEASLNIHNDEIVLIEKIFKKNSLTISGRPRRFLRSWVSGVAPPPELRILVDLITDEAVVKGIIAAAVFDLIKKLANAAVEIFKKFKEKGFPAPHITLIFKIPKRGQFAVFIEDDNAEGVKQLIEGIPKYLEELKTVEEQRILFFNPKIYLSKKRLGPREKQKIDDLVIDFKEREIYLNSTITKLMAMQVIDALNKLDNSNKGEEITIYIDSTGGDMNSCIAIAETMTKCKSPIRTVVTDKAYSGAALIAACGTKGKRIAAKSARFMLHEVQTELGPISEVEKFVKAIERKEAFRRSKKKS